MSITQNMSRGPQGRNIRNGKIETRITTVEFRVIRRNPNAPLFAHILTEKEKEKGERERWGNGRGESRRKLEDVREKK